MVAKKRKSKRQTLQKKYKIIKRTQEHHRKLKKGVLVNAGRKKIDNHIPNAWPQKEELLREIQAAKDKMEEMKQRQKEKRREEQSRSKLGLAAMDVEQPKNQLNVPTKEFIAPAINTDLMDNSSKLHNLGQNSRRAYLKELRKVVDSADVMLMVLDARDPLGTRSTSVEEMVLSNHRKRLVYVLNKADLVPRDVLAGWLTYLRKSHPTVPFKCNTQVQKENLGRASGKVVKQQEGALHTNQAIGAEELIGLLKNYSRVGDTKTIISVGIAGFPNVGKSSLINSLVRTRAVGVSSTPGFTKVTQEVILDKNIRLIDSPGIVFADGNSTTTALRNCVNVEELEDVLTPVQAILERCPQQYLMQLYTLPKFKEQDCMSFLALVARSTGKLKKGGIPNTDAAARSVLHDWNSGRIKFYCRPPKMTPAGAAGSASEADTMILNEYSAEMNLGDLKEEDIRVLDAIDAQNNDVSFVGVEPVAGALDMHIGEPEESSTAAKPKKKTTKKSSSK